MKAKYRVGTKVRLNPNKDYSLIFIDQPHFNCVLKIVNKDLPCESDIFPWTKGYVYDLEDGLSYPENYLMRVKK